MDVLARILHKHEIERLAGSKIFERGEQYFAEGRVHLMKHDGNELGALVVGTESYRAKIWVRADALAYTCACPFSVDEGLFCKHLVALSLAWLRDVTE